MKKIILLILILSTICNAGVLTVKSATHNNDPTTVGTKDNDAAPFGMQGALDNVAAGDEIRIWADGTYNVATTLDVDGTTGTNASWVTINGANASGTVDGTRVTFIATAELTSGVFHFNNEGTDYYQWNYINIDGDSDGGTHASYCIYNEDAYDGQTFCIFQNCRFTDAEVDGIYWSGAYWHFINCEADLNDDDGWEADTGDGNYSAIIGCSSHDNGGDGMFLDCAYSKFFFNIVYCNGSNGINVDSAADNCIFINNTVYGNTVDGFLIDTDCDGCFLMNNTSCGNAGDYGYNLDSDILHFSFFGYNHANGNDTAETDIGGTWATLGNGSNQDGAPAFTSVSDGAEDFTPGSGSDLIGNGFPGTITDQSSGTQDGHIDIGALQHADSGGGGGQVIGGSVVK